MRNTPKSSDSIIIEALRVIARDLEEKFPLRALPMYTAAEQLEQLAAQNKKLRQACAAVLSADEPGCPTLREARALCAEALKEVAE